MVDVYKYYVGLVELLDKYEFRVRVADANGSQSYSRGSSFDEVSDLCTWLCFACNCCMREKFFHDYFGRL